jgi:pimeloyl-ACP methyl ester carboxylesterase
MDEWFWTIGLGPALARLRGTGPSGAGPPEVGDGTATKIGIRTVDGLRIRSAECGGGMPGTMLMTCPWPESMYAFAPIWDALARHFHVVVLDLPGFGGSEGRDDLLSPRAMGEFLVRFADEAGLADPHLVAPDVGTAAALFAAAANPGRFTSVVVGSGGAAVPVELTGPLGEWVLAPDLDRFRALDPRAVVGAALDTIEGYEVPPEIRDDYVESYAGDRFVESMRYARRYPDELPQLAALLPDIEAPVLIVAGRRDRVVPLANDEFLDARLPASRLVIVDAGHFVWEEAAGEYESLVLDWATGGHRDVAR